MNALKHMEAVFVIALSVAGVGSYLAATSQEANAAPVQTVQAAQVAQAAAPMAVVTVVARRLTATEKAQSLRDEAAATRVASR